MPDIEKVKTGIFEMLQRNTWKDIDDYRHRFQPVLNDALELLKEQEAVEPSKDIVGNRRCPKCFTILEGKFCHKCGQEVKWYA